MTEELRKNYPDLDYDKVTVVDLVFPYENAEMIKLLEKRGHQIAAQNWFKLHKVEEEIEKLTRENRTKITRPTQAFVTFLHDCSKEIAENAEPKKEHPFLRNKFKAAAQPSDIIWQNRWNTVNYIRLREFISLAVVVLSLTVVFIIMYLISQKVNFYVQKYPNADCEQISNVFGPDLEEYAL